MKRTALVLFLASLAVPAVTQGAGFAFDQNVKVLAESQALAEEVLAKANRLRARIAEAWLGAPLKPDAGPVVIQVRVSESADDNFSWPMDNPKRTLHAIWLTTTRQRALGSALEHEMTHIVLATALPDRLPAWAEEGAASLTDDSERVAARRRLLDGYARTGNWPDLKGILETRRVGAGDEAGYVVAASLTEYLLTEGDRAKFLRFAQMGKEYGWDYALKQVYGIRSLADLERAWRGWTAGPAAANAVTALRHPAASSRP